jgi:hypothetical protein
MKLKRKHSFPYCASLKLLCIHVFFKKNLKKSFSRMSFVLAFYSRGTYFHLTKAISNLQKLFIIIVSWQPGGVFGPDIKQRGGTAEIIK